jgi:hypothetical protein
MRGATTPAYACRLRTQDGPEIDLGRARPLADLGGLGVKPSSLPGFAPGQTEP